MFNQSESVQLEGVDLARAQRQEQFTLVEAACYWAGYLTISRKDAAAKTRFAKLSTMLEDAAKAGELGDVKPQTKTEQGTDSGDFASTRWDDPVPLPVQVEDWKGATVTRDTLLSFAKSLGDKPAFLFPTYNFSDREAPKLANMLAALIVAKIGKDTLQDFRKEKSDQTAKVMKLLQNAGCTLDETSMRGVLKKLPDPH